MAWKRSARLALTYAVIAGMWIAVSDEMLLVLGLPAESLVKYSLLKGFGFVAVTTLALFALVLRFGRESERREREYRELFDQNPNPMWFYDLETLRFLRVNDAAVAKYGYGEDEFLAMTIADIRPAEDLERLHQNVEAVRNGESSGTESGAWRHLTKDGRTMWVDISSHATEFEGRRAEAVLVRDLTEAHAARQELVRMQRETLRREEERKWGSSR